MKKSQKSKEIRRLFASILEIIIGLVLIAIICNYVNANLAIAGTSLLIAVLVVCCACIAAFMLYPIGKIMDFFSKLKKKWSNKMRETKKSPSFYFFIYFFALLKILYTLFHIQENILNQC